MGLLKERREPLLARSTFSWNEGRVEDTNAKRVILRVHSFKLRLLQSCSSQAQLSFMPGVLEEA